jgi:hypothetical protein
VKVVQTPESISNPQMVYLEDGSVIISWEADRLLYCQKLDTTGVIHWDADGIRVCFSDSNQRDYHMVTDGQDVWFVWQDERNDDGDIYAQKINGSTSQRLWGEQSKEVCVKEGTQRLQTCTVLPSGSFIATWDDYSIDPRDVVAQWFDINGQQLWGPSGIYVTRSTGGGYKPITLSSGEAMLDVWLGVRTGDSVGAYFAQRVDTDGNFLWDTLGVLVDYISTPYSECSDGVGGAVVLFGNPGYLGVQRIDSTGQVVWIPGGVVIRESNALSTSNPALVPEEPINGLISDNAGGCFAWFGKDITMRVQYIDSTGGLAWGSNGTAYWTREAYYEGPIVATKICSDGNNGVFAVYDNLEWNDSLDPTINLGVLVQRINANGQPVFEDNGVMARVWPRDIDSLPWGRFLSAATAVPSGVITAWGDNRDAPHYSMYAQIVDTTGKVGSGIDETPQQISTLLLEVSSVISSENVTLKYSLPVSEKGTLKLFDASGRLIESKTLYQREGVINLDTRNYPQGVYFVQLTSSKHSPITKKLVVVR